MTNVCFYLLGEQFKISFLSVPSVEGWLRCVARLLEKGLGLFFSKARSSQLCTEPAGLNRLYMRRRVVASATLFYPLRRSVESSQPSSDPRKPHKTLKSSELVAREQPM